ncbi:MAG: DUF58 domain-containing protein [Angustibacter sp.]
MQLSLTTRGRAVLAAGITAVACALVMRQLDLLRVGILLGTLPLLSLASLYPWRGTISQVTIARPRTRRIACGQSCNISVELKNSNAKAMRMLLGQEQLPHHFGRRPRFLLPGLAPGQERRVVYAVQPPTRGRFVLGPLSLGTTDPFGLAQGRYQTGSLTELIVHPRVYPLLGAGGTGVGSTAGHHGMGALDEHSLRQYSQGDDLRRVHWRTSARRGILMVRQPEPESTRGVTIVVSTAPAPSGSSSGEWLIDLAASVVQHHLAAGFAVELRINGRPAVRGAALVDYLDHLADAGHPDAGTPPAPNFSSGPRPGSIIALLADASTARCQSLVTSFGSGGANLALVQPPRAAGATQDRNGIAPLRRAGWQVALAEYQQSGAQLWRDARISPEGSRPRAD